MDHKASTIVWCVGLNRHTDLPPELVAAGAPLGSGLNILLWAEGGFQKVRRLGRTKLGIKLAAEELVWADEEFFTSSAQYMPSRGRLRTLHKISADDLRKLGLLDNASTNAQPGRDALIAAFDNGRPLDVYEAKALAIDAGRQIVKPPPGCKPALGATTPGPSVGKRKHGMR